MMEGGLSAPFLNTTTMQQYIDTIKDLFPKAHVKVRNPQTLVVSPPGFFSPERIQSMADIIQDVLPNTSVHVGQGGVVEGQIVVSLSKES